MAENGTWIRVAAKSEIAENSVAGVKVGEREIAIYNLGGEIYATSGLCTHAWALMSQGYIEEGQYIDCPLHFARFDIKTGKAMCAPADADLETYKVRVTGEDIELLLPAG